MSTFNQAIDPSRSGFLFEAQPVARKAVRPQSAAPKTARKPTTAAVDVEGRYAVIATATSTVLLGAFLVANVVASLQVPSVF